MRVRQNNTQNGAKNRSKQHMVAILVFCYRFEYAIQLRLCRVLGLSGKVHTKTRSGCIVLARSIIPQPLTIPQ